MFRISVLLSLLCLLCVHYVSGENALARGWGDNINWVATIEEATTVAAQENKPIMVVLHKTWCGACKRLKPVFGSSEEIEQLSANFIMVNLEDDEHPKGEEYSPDGGYIPRILFLNKEGKVQNNVYNENGNPQYKYYYATVPQITSVMKSAPKKIN